MPLDTVARLPGSDSYTLIERYLSDLPRWDVFDPQSAWLGTVETPVGLEVYEIGADYLLGRRARPKLPEALKRGKL